MTSSDFDAEPIDTDRHPDIEFKLGGYPLDLTLQAALAGWFGGAVAVGARTVAEQSRLYAEALMAAAASAKAAGPYVHAVVADETHSWGLAVDVNWDDPKPVTLATGEGWHVEYTPPPRYIRGTGYKGRAARRREERGKDPYDDPSHHRTSPTGFPPPGTRPPRNHQPKSRRRG